VPPEVIFDQGLGDLFVIRVAGNVLDDIVVGSVEYAAAHLHTPLIVVLGHARCGAVGATVAGGELEGHLPSLAEAIQPAVDQVQGLPGDLVDNAVRANAKMVAEQLKSSHPVLSELVNAGALKIVAARYDLDTGLVELLQA
jgi:carbonic anhydrase